jgi:hypothetical protein
MVSAIRWTVPEGGHPWCAVKRSQVLNCDLSRARAAMIKRSTRRLYDDAVGGERSPVVLLQTLPLISSSGMETRAVAK